MVLMAQSINTFRGLYPHKGSSHCIISPLVSEFLPTVSADPGVTAKMDYLHLSAVRADIYATSSLFAGQHLLHFFYLNLSELLPVPVLIDIPVVVVREDVV